MSFEYYVYFRPLTVHKILFMAMIVLKHDMWLWHNNGVCFIHDKYYESQSLFLIGTSNWAVTISRCFVWVVYTPLERLCLYTYYLPF